MSARGPERPGATIPKAYAWMTVAIAILTLTSSAAGLLVSGTYGRDTPDWAHQARAQDVANVVAVVILLLVTYPALRRSPRGYQAWAGVLLFLIYSLAIYSFASSFNGLFLLYVADLGLLVYAFLGAVVRLDFERVRESFAMKERPRLALGVVLVVLGLLFYVIWLSEDVPALLDGTVPASVTQAGLLSNPVHVLDMAMYLPAFIIAGVSLVRNGGLGLALGLPLLVFGAFTVFGIVLIFAM